jgi:isoleucyl-tRNA synthetase
VSNAYASFEFYKIYHSVHNFCAVDLSAFYLDVLKDRLYCDKAGSQQRRSAQTVLYEVLLAITKLYAPILPFTTEEIWGFLPPRKGGYEESVHCAEFPALNAAYLDDALATRWEELLTFRNEVNKRLEEARRERKIGSGLEAEIVLTAQGKDLELLHRYEALLPTLFIVSKVTLEEETLETTGYKITVRSAPGMKCERCWNYRISVGENPDHPTICERCWKAIEP